MPEPTVVHMCQDDSHAVLIHNLRVLVAERDGVWDAQGVEIDYAASGDSLEDVQRRFERGLGKMIQLHLQRFGSISRLLKFAPEAIVAQVSDAKPYSLRLLARHDLAPARGLPFNAVAYIEAPQLAA